VKACQSCGKVCSRLEGLICPKCCNTRGKCTHCGLTRTMLQIREGLGVGPGEDVFEALADLIAEREVAVCAAQILQLQVDDLAQRIERLS
jgi:hypothetical protein